MEPGWPYGVREWLGSPVVKDQEQTAASGREIDASLLQERRRSDRRGYEVASVLLRYHCSAPGRPPQVSVSEHGGDFAADSAGRSNS